MVSKTAIVEMERHQPLPQNEALKLWLRWNAHEWPAILRSQKCLVSEDVGKDRPPPWGKLRLGAPVSHAADVDPMRQVSGITLSIDSIPEEN